MDGLWLMQPAAGAFRRRKALALAVLFAMAWWGSSTEVGLVVPVAAWYLIPVVLAAFWFRLPGAVVASIATVLLSGPLAPSGLHQERYTVEWLPRLVFVLSLGGIVGVMSGLLAERARRLERAMVGVQRMYGRTLRGFMTLLELKDSETTDHCERVARNAVVVGERLGLVGRRLDSLYWAGYLHDLGKLGTPARILLKPGSLTNEEYAEVKLHTEAGARVLEQASPAFHDIALGVRHHHERWDGRGYPVGLSGNDIPLFGRILAVVDVFEALTSVRPYRPAFSVEEAANMLREESGTQFDPAMVETLLALLHEGVLYREGQRSDADERVAPILFDPVDTVGAHDPLSRIERLVASPN